MHFWQILGVVGICFLILEMFTPSLFFLNFALAAFLCAPMSVFVKNPYTLTIFFCVMSFLSFVFLRPILIKQFNKDGETGINSKYIGKVVRIDADITNSAGVISIYGERWDARSENGELIPSGSEVKIVRNDSLIMYVEKVSE